MKNKTVKPVIFLILLAPFTGEVLSTSTPFFALLNPIVLIPLIFLYGFGALIIREFLVKWKKVFLSLLIWGSAYGIIEEGIILRSFFNPYWNIGDLAVYGRIWGVSWIWVIQVTVYHAFFSITAPIMLAHLVFPDVAHENWVSRRSLIIAALLFSFVAAPLFYLISPYNQPIAQYVLFIIITVILLYVGKKLPSIDENNLPQLPTSPKKIFFWSAIFTPLFFITTFITPKTSIPWPITAVILIVWPLFILWKIDPSFGLKFVWTPKQKIAFVAGTLSFLIYFMPLISKDPLGQVIASIITIAILVKVIRQYKAK